VYILIILYLTPLIPLSFSRRGGRFFLKRDFVPLKLPFSIYSFEKTGKIFSEEGLRPS